MVTMLIIINAYFVSLYVQYKIDVNSFFRMASHLASLGFAISKWLCSLSC